MTDDFRSYPSKTLLEKHHNGFYVVAKLFVAHSDAVKLHVDVAGVLKRKDQPAPSITQKGVHARPVTAREREHWFL